MRASSAVCVRRDAALIFFPFFFSPISPANEEPRGRRWRVGAASYETVVWRPKDPGLAAPGIARLAQVSFPVKIHRRGGVVLPWFGNEMSRGS